MPSSKELSDAAAFVYQKQIENVEAFRGLKASEAAAELSSESDDEAPKAALLCLEPADAPLDVMTPGEERQPAALDKGKRPMDPEGFVFDTPPKRRVAPGPARHSLALATPSPLATLPSKRGGRPPVHLLAPASRLISPRRFMELTQSERRLQYERAYGKKTTSANMAWLYHMCCGRAQGEYEPLAKVAAEKKQKRMMLDQQRAFRESSERWFEMDERAQVENAAGIKAAAELELLIQDEMDEIAELEALIAEEEDLAEEKRGLESGASEGANKVEAPQCGEAEVVVDDSDCDVWIDVD